MQKSLPLSNEINHPNIKKTLPCIIFHIYPFIQCCGGLSTSGNFINPKYELY